MTHIVFPIGPYVVGMLIERLRATLFPRRNDVDEEYKGNVG